MRNLLLLALSAAYYSVRFARAENAPALRYPPTPTATTWYSTSFVSDDYSTRRIIEYGNSPITPVPTSTTFILLAQITLTEPTASRDINKTTWVTQTSTAPLTTETVYTPLTTPLPPRSTFINSTTTAYVWTSSSFATLTFTKVATAAACHRQGSKPATTVTRYTGTYTPLPGQTSTSRSKFPTSVITQYYHKETHRLYPYTGSTVTHTETGIEMSYLSTATTTVTISNAGGRYVSSVYASTVTGTRTDYQLAYKTVTSTATCTGQPKASAGAGTAGTTVTLTQARKCAPTNLLSEQEGLGVAIRILPGEWSFPIGFPNTVIGIPGGASRTVDNTTDGPTIPDASACCQLCVDNPGCAASEWVVAGAADRGDCRTYWYHANNQVDEEKEEGGGGARRRDTCGKWIGGSFDDDGDLVGLQYLANPYALPGQASYIQAGCGRLKYVGKRDPWS